MNERSFSRIADGDKVRDEILGFIIRYRMNHDLPPTQREIADALYLSTTTIHYHLHKMHEDGSIELCGQRGIKVRGGRWVYTK